MYKKVAAYFEQLIYADIKSLPSEMRKDFFEEITNTDYKRIKPVCIAIALMYIILSIINSTVLRKVTPQIRAADNMLILHFAGSAYSLVFSIIYVFVYSNLKLFARRIVNFGYILVTILVCELISLNTYIIYGQIITIIMCMISFACIYVFNYIIRIIIFSLTYVSFLVVLNGAEISPAANAGFVIILSIVYAFCLLFSKYCFKSFLEQFINRKIIINNIKEIGRLNADLENKVKERTEALAQANAQIELERLHISFFTNLSHEFRTPINVILAAQQLLYMKLSKTVPSKDYESIKRNLHSIEQNSYRLMRLSSNLIDITRIDAGYYSINPFNVNIVLVLEEIVTVVSSFIKSRGINIIFESYIEEKIIAIDAEKIERALLNLLSNAVKFSPANSNILVKLSEDEDMLRISVKDSGIGIPNDMKDLIFNRFVQVDKTLTRDREGSGLGLSIVKSIIELHHGKISVNSDLYNGSEFIISLPIKTINEDIFISSYSFEGQDSLDLLKIEFSDIET